MALLSLAVRNVTNSKWCRSTGDTSLLSLVLGYATSTAGANPLLDIHFEIDAEKCSLHLLHVFCTDIHSEFDLEM